MISGLIVTLAYMLLNARDPSFNVLGITNVAAGVFGVPVNFLMTIVVSKLTPPPPQIQVGRCLLSCFLTPLPLSGGFVHGAVMRITYPCPRACQGRMHRQCCATAPCAGPSPVATGEG
jgi:hypothetical protein